MTHLLLDFPPLLVEAERLTRELWSHLHVYSPEDLPNTWARRIDAHAALLADLSRPASRDHWCRWAAKGERCHRCHGDGATPDPHSARPPLCQDCVGTGYLRPPRDLRHLSDLGGALTPEQSAACLAWSARSIVAGGEPIRSVLGPWRLRHSPQRPTLAGEDILCVVYMLNTQPHRWTLLDGDDKEIAGGPQTGAEGRAKADAAALKLNLALLDEAGVVTLPALPEGA